MHIATWMTFAFLALFCFGVAGLLWKLSTDRMSAESALVWLIGGSLMLERFVYPGRSVWQYSTRSIAFICLAGVLNSLGNWAILAAMKNGGKASVVVPLTAIYPMVVCLVASFLLKEPITFMQGAGIASGMGAIFLLAS